MKALLLPFIFILSLAWSFQLEVAEEAAGRSSAAIKASSALVTVLFFFAAAGVLNKWRLANKHSLVMRACLRIVLPIATFLLPLVNGVFPLALTTGNLVYAMPVGGFFLVVLTVAGSEVGVQLKEINERIKSSKQHASDMSETDIPVLGIVMMHIFYLYLLFGSPV